MPRSCMHHFVLHSIGLSSISTYSTTVFQLQKRLGNLSAYARGKGNNYREQVGNLCHIKNINEVIKFQKYTASLQRAFLKVGGHLSCKFMCNLI